MALNTEDEKAEAYNIEMYGETTVQLEKARSALRKEILEELDGRLMQDPDILSVLSIKNKISETTKILEGNALTGEDADKVSSTLANILTLGVGYKEIISDLIHQWRFLYPLEIEIRIDNLAAREYIASQNSQNLSE